MCLIQFQSRSTIGLIAINGLRFLWLSCMYIYTAVTFCLLLISQLSVLPTLSSPANPLTPNDHYSGRTTPLTSKRYILYIYSTNIGTEYFKHGIYSPFFFSSKCSLFHNSNLFCSCIIHILYTECTKRGILYIYSTNIGTEYFKHGIYSPFFPSKCSLFHNSNVFGSCIVYILYTGCAKRCILYIIQRI